MKRCNALPKASKVYDSCKRWNRWAITGLNGKRVAGKVDILLAQNQIVPLFGRNDELDDMQNWCAEEGNLAIRTYYGEGGTGKTRLLIEAIDRQGRSGTWACGFLSGYEQTPSGELGHDAEATFA